MDNNEFPFEEFKVIGAGTLKLSHQTDIMCGGDKGFSLDASWGRFGYIGGVISQTEAKKLADFIYQKLSIKNG